MPPTDLTCRERRRHDLRLRVAVRYMYRRRLAARSGTPPLVDRPWSPLFFEAFDFTECLEFLDALLPNLSTKQVH